MARHALFPETILESDSQTSLDDGASDEAMGGAEDDLDALLATLEGWSSQDKSEETSADASVTSSVDASAASDDVLVDELQAWRTQHAEQNYDEWSPEKQKEFMVGLVIMQTEVCNETI